MNSPMEKKIESPEIEQKSKTDLHIYNHFIYDKNAYYLLNCAPPQIYIGVLTPGTSECDLIWEGEGFRYNQ